MNAKVIKAAFNFAATIALRPAAIEESNTGSPAILAYARSMKGATEEEVDAEVALFKSEGGNPSVASAIKRVALDKAEGDPNATSVMRVAYAYAEKGKGAGGEKKPAAPRVVTPMQVMALWLKLDDAAKKEFRDLILKHK